MKKVLSSPGGKGEIEYLPAALGITTDPVLLFPKQGGWIGPINTFLGESGAAARILAELLARMTGVTIAVEEQGRSGPGFYVGTYAEWAIAGNEIASLETDEEDYVLVSRQQAVWLLGKDSLQVERAVYSFLYWIGYRKFSPGDAWEVTPDIPSLRVHLSARESSRFKVLNFAYGGPSSFFKDFIHPVNPFEQWKRINMIYTSKNIQFGHWWGKVLINPPENVPVFDAHPEYVTSKGTKFCVLNEGLQDCVLANVREHFRVHPEDLAASVSASDGTLGWDESCSTGETEQYTPSDRVVLLASKVVERLRKDPAYANKYVAMLAYGDTSWPPEKEKVNPAVIVVITTTFIKGGQTVKEIAAGYRAQGARHLGIHEALATFTWDHNVTGRSKISKPTLWPEIVAESLAIGNPKFLFFSAESTAATTIWDGLGYWVLSKLFYAPDQQNLTGQINQLLADFFTNAFGDLAEEMRAFYAYVDGGAGAPLLTTDLLHNMFEKLKAARKAIKAQADPKIRQRVDELVLYTEWLARYRAFEVAPLDSEEELDLFDRMMAFVYRIRYRFLVDYRGFFDEYPALIAKLSTRYSGLMAGKPISEFSATDGHPWPGTPFTPEEITAFIDNGISNHAQHLNFNPIQFSKDLVKPGAFRDLVKKRTFSPSTYELGNQSWYVYIDGQVHTSFTFRAQAGMVEAYRDKGPAKAQLVNLQTGAVAGAVLLPPDNVDRTYTFPKSGSGLVSGLYRLDVLDQGGFRLEWDPGYAVTKILAQNPPTGFEQSWGMYFYVPRGTTVIGGFWEHPNSQLIDPDGNVVLVNPNGTNSYFSHPVPAGGDGQIWQVDNCKGLCILLTVPPQAARSPQELLLPREVVEADKLR